MKPAIRTEYMIKPDSESILIDNVWQKKAMLNHSS